MKVAITGATGFLGTNTDLFVSGDLAFFSYYSAGFKVYNIAEPTTPVLVGTFDTDPINTPGFTGAFGVDAFLPSGMILVSGQSGTDPGKLHILNVEGFTTVGVDDAPIDRGPELSLEVFPNPARTETTISFDGHGETTLSVFDIVGREIYSEALNSRTGTSTTNWNVASLPSGVYYIHVVSGQLQESKTISIVR